MQVKLLDLVEINEVLVKFLEYAKTVKFSYALAKNITILSKEIEPVEKIQKAKPNFETFEKERIELCMRFCKKDTIGQPIQDVGSDGIPRFVFDDMTAFDNEFVTLRAKHTIAIEERERQLVELRDLLQTEVEVEFYKIPLVLFDELKNIEKLGFMIKPLVNRIIIEE